MTKITYQVGSTSGSITWAASEYFGELTDQELQLGAMEATAIAKLTHLSLTAQLLLSAVAGAIIQHLLDQGFSATDIFTRGSFRIKNPTEKAPEI